MRVTRLAMLAVDAPQDYTWTVEISSLSVHLGSTLKPSSPLTLSLSYSGTCDCDMVRRMCVRVDVGWFWGRGSEACVCEGLGS